MIVRALLLCTLFACTVTHAQVMDEVPDPVLRDLLIAAVEDSSSFNDRFDAEVWLVDMSSRLRRQCWRARRERAK